MEGLKFLNLSKCYNKTNELGEDMSTYTIQNSFVSVTIDEHAAEIHSFFDRETNIILETMALLETVNLNVSNIPILKS